MLSITTFVYALAAFLYIFSWVFKKPAASTAAMWVTVLGIVGNTAGILMRWVASYDLGFGHAPFSNLYESLIFFAWTIAIIFVIIDRKYKMPIVGTFTVPLAFLALAYASLNPNIIEHIQPLLPALKSNWLIAHVITCFVGYAAFAIGFGVSIMYLLKNENSPGKGGWTGDSSGCGCPRCALLPAGHVRLSVFDHRDHHRCRMGEFRMGSVLGMGPERDLVPDYMDHLCNLASREKHAGMARQADRLAFHHRICGRDLYLFRRQFSAGTA